MNKQACAVAIRMLARREHSRCEIQTRLSGKGFGESEIDNVIEQLLNDDHLNEARFTEAFVASHVLRGSGPLKIRAELQQRGISESLMNEFLNTDTGIWCQRAEQVRQKRFGSSLPEDFTDKARQMRFLQQRGFAQAHIIPALKGDAFEAI